MNSTSNPPPRTAEPVEGGRKRALVIRIGALGDVLLTRRLTCSLFRAGIVSTLLAPLRHACLLLRDPWIEAVLDSESPRLAGAFAGHWPAAFGRFDLAVVISGSASLRQAARLAAPRVMQMAPEPFRPDLSVARQWAEGVATECDPFPGILPSLPTGEEALQGPGTILIHPGSGSPRKNWPIERFRELSVRLLAIGHPVVWIRGPAESETEGPPSGAGIIERPSLPALAATLAGARLFIGNDSGVSHLAAAVGAPTLALFGATSPTVWSPDGARVRVVRSPTPVMADLPLQEVLAVATALGANIGGEVSE